MLQIVWLQLGEIVFIPQLDFLKKLLGLGEGGYKGSREYDYKKVCACVCVGGWVIKSG